MLDMTHLGSAALVLAITMAIIPTAEAVAAGHGARDHQDRTTQTQLADFRFAGDTPDKPHQAEGRGGSPAGSKRVASCEKSAYWLMKQHDSTVLMRCHNAIGTRS